MSSRALTSLLAALGLAVAVSPAAAQSSASQPSRLPDWTGIWENISGIHFTNPNRTPNPPPLNAEYAAKYKLAVDAARAGRPINDPTANCVWPGVPRVIVAPYPSEFVFSEGRVTVIQEYMSQVRRIWTDGRGHPEDLDPSYNGHSIGHWEGDTLVVETVGLREDTMYENTGLPHSDELRIVERIRLVEPDLLENQVTATDPKALTAPWTSTIRFRRHRDWKIMDYVCEENNRRAIVDGVTVMVR